MHFNIFKTAAWQLILQADVMCWILLLGLFVASVFCIAIIAFKFAAFRSERRFLDMLIQRMRSVRTFTDLIAVSKECRDGIGGRLLISGLTELKDMLDAASKKKNGAPGEETNSSLRPNDIEILERVLGQEIDGLIMEQESYLPVLSTSAAVGPLIGLFGTIWGLIHSFIDISQEKSADIATVAPGLAEVLMTTLGGLVVAIPALIAFHYFASQVRKFDYQLNQLGDNFLSIVKQTFVK